jgi:hypothetical protein
MKTETARTAERHGIPRGAEFQKAPDSKGVKSQKAQNRERRLFAPSQQPSNPSMLRFSSRVLALCCCLGCQQSEGSYQGYVDRTASTGDSALATVTSYLTLDSTKTVRYDSAAAAQLERLATRFGGIMRPDTVAIYHRQMLEGLDSLVLAMRMLHDRETSCNQERTIDCVDPRDFGYILGSFRNGARIYLDARRRMRETMRSLGATFPDPPPVSAAALTPQQAAPPRPAP